MKKYRGITTVETILLIAVLVIGVMVAAVALKKYISKAAEKTGETVEKIATDGTEQWEGTD